MLDIFFTNLRKLITFALVLIFAFVIIYTPQDFTKKIVSPAQAFIVSDPGHTAVSSAGYAFQAGLIVKETVLDGIAWAIAKQVVASMVSDLVDWINSGFQGSPAFITDLDQYLLEAADAAAGQFIEELGGDASYLCSPFQLNIQVALAVEYDRIRDDRPYEGCTLSDIVGNLEDFLSGSFIQEPDISVQNVGGENPVDAAWDNWLQVINHPDKYTEFGVYLSEQERLLNRIAEAERNQTTEANWGDGFKSNKVCETVDNGGNNATLRCAIVTPGKQISDTLSRKLGLGDDTLVTADEISEIIGALIAQLGNQAITGAAGLLGLSANTGYTYSGFSGGSYTNAASNEVAGSDSDGFRSSGLSTLQEALQIQTDYKSFADATVPVIQSYLSRTDISEEQRVTAQTYLHEAQMVQTNAPTYISELQDMVTRYQALQNELDNSSTSSTRKTTIRQSQSTIINEFLALKAYTEGQLNASKQNWDTATF